MVPILSLLGVFGSLVSDATGNAEVINDNKTAQRQFEELKRRNRIMEDHGVYLTPYKRGVTTEKIKKIKKRLPKLLLKMLKDVTANVQL